MRKNVVLIDFESVQPESLSSLEPDHFHVLVFVGATQAKVPFELAAAVQRLGTRAEYVKISGNGRNALDFHIAFYIGQLAARDPNAHFHVISKDAGFDPLIQHLKSRKILAGRLASIAEIPVRKALASKSPTERAAFVIGKLSQPKATRPRTVKTLSSAVSHFFQKALSDDEIGAVVSAMAESGFVSVAAGKVTYRPGT